MFFKKKINSEEFETLHKKIVLCTGELDVLRTELANLKTSVNSLRGFVNRSGNKQEDETNKNSSIFLNTNGNPL